MKEKAWPTVEGFTCTTWVTDVPAMYRKKGEMRAGTYKWICCQADGEFWVQTGGMVAWDKEGIQCKTLDEAVATVNALAALNGIEGVEEE